MDIKCRKCGYKWDYKGKLIFANCPSCGAKNKVHGRDRNTEQIQNKNK